MDAPKQARIDAWESRLADEQQRELYRWTQTPIKDEEGNLRRPNFDECMARVDGLGVGRPSRTAWFRFKARMEKERRLEMLYSVKGSGESAKDLTAMSPADYELAANAFTNLAIDAAMKGNEKAVGIYSGAARHYRDMIHAGRELALKTKAQKTKDEQLRLAREKFEAAERRLDAARGAVEDATLTDAERVAKVKSIFGIK